MKCTRHLILYCSFPFPLLLKQSQLSPAELSCPSHMDSLQDYKASQVTSVRPFQEKELC